MKFEDFVRALLALALVIALVLSFGKVFVVDALAQGHHDPNNPAHWYDNDCCNMQDCRPISGVHSDGTPWTEIEDRGDVFIWTSSKTGAVYHIPKGGSKIRASQDSRYHGCENPGGVMGGPYGATEAISPPWWICVYEPVAF